VDKDCGKCAVTAGVARARAVCVDHYLVHAGPPDSGSIEPPFRVCSSDGLRRTHLSPSLSYHQNGRRRPKRCHPSFLHCHKLKNRTISEATGQPIFFGKIQSTNTATAHSAAMRRKADVKG